MLIGTRCRCARALHWLSKLWRENASFTAKVLKRPIADWDVSGVTDMSGCFKGFTTFNGDLSRWNVPNVTNMSKMFCGATFQRRLECVGRVERDEYERYVL